jgi:hypothetical protein
MVASLSRLTELGDKDSLSRLGFVASALDLREAMRKALDQHDHERAVINADRFLTFFPNHEEGLRVLRESGKIFWLLGSAQAALSATDAARPPFEHFAVVEPASLSPKGRSKEPPKELDAWRIARMQEGLRELGHRIDDKEGLYGPSTKKATQAVLSKDQLKGGFGAMVRHVANKVDAHRRVQEDRAHEAGRLKVIAEARALVSKARQIDPHFKESQRLDALLDQANSATPKDKGEAAFRLATQDVMRLELYRDPTTKKIIERNAGLFE